MNFTKSYNFEGSIHHGFFIRNLIGVIDNKVNLLLFELGDEKLLPVNKKDVESEVLHPYHKADSSSNSGHFVVLYVKNNGYVLKYDDEKRNYESYFSLSWCKGGIEYTTFSSDEKLVIAGGADGKVYLYSLEHKKLQEIISINNEYISSLSISRDNNLVAFSSFKKNLDIYDLRNNMLTSRHIHNEVITVCEFLHKSNFLIYGARDTRVVLYDFISNSIKKELVKTIDWPLAILVEDNDNFCLVSDKSGHVFFIDLYNIETKQEILFYANGNAVVNMKKQGSKYLFFHENGSINIFDLDLEMLQIEQAFNDKDYEKFFKLTSSNPILKFKGNNLFQSACENFEKELENAILNIAIGEIDSAKKIMAPYLENEKNRDVFNFYIANAPKIKSFYEMVDNHEYDKVYALASTANYYKKLPRYKELEEEFVQTFNMAEMLLIEGEKNTQKAQHALRYFAKVPDKKSVIVALFKSPKLFKQLDEMFSQNRLNDFYKKIQEFPQTKDAPIYNEYITEINKRISNFLKALKEKNYDEAYEMSINIKKDIPDVFTKSLESEFDRIKHIKEFARAMKAKKIKLAVALVEQYPFLISVDEYAELEAFLNKHFNAALKYAYHGKIDEVHKYIEKFVGIEYTKQRSIKIYKIAYIQQITALAEKMKELHWRDTILRYISRFGVDAELEILTKKFDKDGLLEKLKNTTKHGFEKLPLLLNIVAGK